MNQADHVENSLYLITDRHRLPPGKTLQSTVEQTLLGGVRLIQLREKNLPAAELWPLAQQMRELTRRYGAKLIINERIDVALACDADGVHLGEQSLPVPEARKLLGPDRLIGVSTHAPEDIVRATAEGANFLTFSPVFATPSKAPYGPPQGLNRLKKACQLTKLPVFALGGIKTWNVQDVLSQGASGIAMISAIISSEDPLNTTRAFLNKMSTPL